MVPALNWGAAPATISRARLLLGGLSGRCVLEPAGARLTVGVDISPARITQARARWGHLPNTRWLTGDAATALDDHGWGAVEVCMSIFGALWYADPAVLLPRIHARLATSGMLAISTGTTLPG